MGANAMEVAKSFVQFYYGALDKGDGNTLGQLYKDASTLSFEGDTVKGQAAIVAKLTGLGLAGQQVPRRVTSVDAQPSCVGQGAIVVFVLGEWAGKQYTELFQLVPAGQNNYYIHNCICRIGLNNMFNVPPEAGEFAKAFLGHYYTKYDASVEARRELLPLYTSTSVVDYEGQRFTGQEQIGLRYLGRKNNDGEWDPAPFPLVKHDPNMACDIQLINGLELVMIMLVGQQHVDTTGDKPMKFAQSFIIVKQGGNYAVGNQFFRLNYG